MPEFSNLDPALSRKHLAFDLGVFTANTNVGKAAFGVPRGGPSWRLLNVAFSALSVPSDADGTMLIQVFNNDLSEGSTDQLVVNFDAETMNPGTAMYNATLITETGERELTLEPGDVVTIRFDSNSAAIDSNPSIRCVVEYCVLPTSIFVQ